MTKSKGQDFKELSEKLNSLYFSFYILSEIDNPNDPEFKELAERVKAIRDDYNNLIKVKV